MNVLILGNNEINGILEKGFSEHGVKTDVVANAADVLKVKGRPGCYAVTTTGGKLDVSSVVITETAEYEAPEVSGNAVCNLMDETARETVLKDKTRDEVVILLDYGFETPEFVTRRAVDLAARLAARKKKVSLLSGFVKSAGAGREEEYRKARDAGVTFVKYESICLSYDEDSRKFEVKANDGVCDVSFKTPLVMAAQKKENKELEAIAKKLRLHYQTPDSLNSDRFFLYPVFTTRRGIYYVNRTGATLDGEKSVKEAVTMIIRDMSAISDADYVHEIVRGHEFPEIDVKKCAFCYTCHRACPHGALEPDLENDGMKTVEAACEACGICIAICPGEAITRKNQAKKSEKGVCKLFCCENGASHAYKEIEGEFKAKVDAESVTCGGRVSADVLTQTLAFYDKVIIACCPEGACRHIDGDKRGCKQVERAVAMLSKADVGGKKIEVVKVSNPMRNALKDKLTSVLEG